MKTNKLAKLIEEHPNAEIIFHNDKEGFRKNGEVEYRKILSWSDLPVEIICDFPYIESDYFYQEQYLIHEMQLGARNTDIEKQINTYIKKIKKFWKYYIIVWIE